MNPVDPGLGDLVSGLHPKKGVHLRAESFLVSLHMDEQDGQDGI